MDLTSKERTQLTKKIRAVLTEKARTSRFLKTLLHYDNLIINGYIVYSRTRN
jgi:hypothetical protein